MARTRLTPITVSITAPFEKTIAGLAGFTAVNAADGMVFENTNGRCIVVVFNAHATDDLSVTAVTPKTVVGLAVADVPHIVDQESFAILGPYDGDTFHQTGTRDINLDFAESGGSGAVAASKIAVLKITPPA